MSRVEAPRRPRPAKRLRTVPDERIKVGRVLRIHPDPKRPHFYVLVRVAHNQAHMRRVIRWWASPHHPAVAAGLMGCMGMVFSRGSRRRSVSLNRGYESGLVAHMFLNVEDLRREPNTIISHECTHAGMAWARMRRANLRQMPGEEVLCYAVGEMVRQLVSAGHALGWFR